MLNRSHGCPRSRRPWTLGLLLLLAAGLVWSLPGDVVARSMFQSSPPETATDTPTPTATAELGLPPTATPTLSVPIEGIAATATFFAPPTVAGPVELPTETPTETSTETPAATPGVPGYLPPPTLTAPGAFPPSAMLSLQGADSAAADNAPPTPAPTATPSPTFAAQLIDNSLLVFGYLWLGCGGMLLILAAGVIVWMWRRGRVG